MKKPVVVGENLSFSYNKTPVLENASFTVYENEFVGIFGPNGGGKTTLLQLLMGFLNPSKGRLEIFGTTPKEARKKIGWVPQHFHYDHSFPISVFEVVLTGRLSKSKWYGGYSKNDHKEAVIALEKVDMLKYRNSPFSELSGGEAQRVLIARALACHPSLLLLDEPTASVDAKTEHKIYNLLDVLKKEITILMVTHDLHVAIHHVERAFCVQSTLSSLTPKELCEHFAIGLYHLPAKPKEV